jgi:hypothetical protein
MCVGKFMESKNYINTAYNPGQTSDYPHGGIYIVSENQMREVEEAKDLICKIDSKLEKIFGSKCYSVIPSLQIELVFLKVHRLFFKG